MILTAAGASFGQTAQRRKVDVVAFWAEQQFDEVSPGGKNALAVHFELEKGWHFYAYPDTAPGGMNIKLEPNEQGTRFLKFSEPILPKSEFFYDASLEKKVDVFGEKFVIYLPFEVAADAPQLKTIILAIGIDGAVCSDVQCRVPDFGSITVEIRTAKDANDSQPRFVLPQAQARPKPITGSSGQWTNYSVWAALALALAAGLSLNIMPCVWPVLPIIVMRLVEQAELNKKKSIVMGIAFCLGILLFFTCLAGANIVLQVFYGQVLQWGDQLRNPAFVTAMATLLVVLALFMFGLFTINVPSSLGGKSGPGKGLGGAIGMGFLAAVLSTPCSFGILAAAFAWAQAQPLGLATLAMMTIGIGMAAPYAILTAVPALLKKTPKPGRWMELFKQTIGFVLLVIAVKLIAALPGERRMGVLYFSVALSFCVWMWGGWVGFGTPAVRRWVVRIIAVALAVAAGFAFLPAPKPSLVDWKPYDAPLIKQAQEAGKPVLMDFTAGWCLSCQVVDRTVYSRKDIADLIKQKAVYAIKADTTLKDEPATIALKEIYNEPGVPVSILLLSGEDPLRWRGLAFGDELKSALEKLPPNPMK
ncbi:MAG: thioredoxin family protein [Sedimentisphaerales bacterium]|nr:thioredoxin family protein [Sedimentisphaerales bacterium]